MQGRRIEALGHPALVLPVDARRWVLADNNYKSCKSCLKFGDVQLAPATMLHLIIKPWPFRGWALDFVGQIHPASSKGYRFVLVATDYFTNGWMLSHFRA
jgi:hypothetical protein